MKQGIKEVQLVVLVVSEKYYKVDLYNYRIIIREK